MVVQARPVVAVGRAALPTAAVGAAVALVGGCLAAMLVLPEDVWSRYVSNLAQLAAPAGAAVALAWRARRSAGRFRWSWALLAAGCAAWAAGQSWWAHEEIVGAGIPFPSVADVGFLLFPLLAAAALLVHPTDGGARGRWRSTSDAVMTSAAVGLVSWETVLSAVSDRSAGLSRLAWVLFLAYPVLDVVLIVLAVLTAARTRGPRLPLRLVCAGVVALSVADSAFAYLQATAAYDGGSADLGWIVGFLLLALAGVARSAATDAAADDDAPAAVDLGVCDPAAELRADLLPYVPVAVALVATVAFVLGGGRLGVAEVVLATVVITLILVRQYLVLRDNVRLGGRLARREAMLRHQAFHDGLTGLANRALFLDRLEQALNGHRRRQSPVALVFLDLDDFKVVNDTLGHAAGDELLVQVAARLRDATRAVDTVARLGGDEFAVLLESGADVQAATSRALEALRAPVVLGGRPVTVRASVGVCVLGPDDPPARPDALLVRSDTAMYAAKRSGKDQIVTYTPGLHLEEVEEFTRADRLCRGLAEGEVSLAYQPIVELGTGRIIALEALARWRPDGREVPPSVFVPLAERAGLLDRLTAQLLDQACDRVAGWSARCDAALSVHVNVAPASLAWSGLVPRVRELVARYDLAPGQLVLELTETGLLAHEEAAERVIRELRAVGVGVALDDFGVGQSSLARLGALTLESVKIDRSFLARIDSDEREATLLGAVFRLARDLALPVVAEGVERPGQLTALRRMGCPRVQGFLLARPVPPTAVPELLGRSAVLTG
ncbi:putative bifunctional diguanylate cyclase/phosphodiesterase [Geodermatophilus sp. SYSU D00815]